MANINLLPWRETRRHTRRQQFLTGLCGTAFIAVLSVWFWDAVVSNQIAYQETRNQKLTTQIKLLDQEVAEIRDLQLKRNRTGRSYEGDTSVTGQSARHCQTVGSTGTNGARGWFSIPHCRPTLRSYRLRASQNPTTGSPVSCAAWRRHAGCKHRV